MLKKTQYKAGDRIKLVYFPGVVGIVDKVDNNGRIWVTLDKDVLDTTRGTSTPIAEHEMQLLNFND